MVANDERYDMLRFLSYFLLAIDSLVFLGLLSSLWPSPHHDITPLSAALFFILLGSIVVFAARRFKAVHLRRQSAAESDSSIPLAAEQPPPDEAALSLPFTITLVPRRGLSFAVGTVVALFFLLFFSWEPFIDPPGQGQLAMILTIILIIVFLGLSVGLAISASMILIRGGHQEITATEGGLTVRRGELTHHIPWREARLFAITPGFLPTNKPAFYELSSAATFALLIRLRRNALFPPNMKPALPFDDYDQQMDALLSLIAAKTGLSLYDLRG